MNPLRQGRRCQAMARALRGNILFIHILLIVIISRHIERRFSDTWNKRIVVACIALPEFITEQKVPSGILGVHNSSGDSQPHYSATNIDRMHAIYLLDNFSKIFLAGNITNITLCDCVALGPVRTQLRDSFSGDHTLPKWPQTTATLLR